MAITSENRVYRRIVPVTIILTLCFGLIYAGAGGTSGQACTVANVLCNDQISFDRAVYGNASTGSPTLISGAWNATHNEAIVLIADSNIGGVITSITDTALDSFTQRIFLSQNCLPCQNFELWTTLYQGATGSVNQITVNWNATTNNVFVASSYKNVVGFLNTTSTQGPAATSGSFAFIPAKTGSMLVGGTALSPASGVPCTTIIAGSNLVQRKDACSQAGIPEVEVDIEDNSTALSSGFRFTYSSSWPSQGFAVAFQMGAVEILGFDATPHEPTASNVCTSTNGLCLTTQYALNYAKLSTIPNSGTVALASGTAYCTGITTVGLTSKAGKPIQVEANYGGFNRNVTAIVGGPDIFMQIYVTTTAPSTTFGAGLCSASGNIEVSTGTCTFSTSGGIIASNACSIGMNGAQSSSTIGTVYYGFIEVTPLNLGLGVGHMQYNQAPLNANAMCSVSMFEAV